MAHVTIAYHLCLEYAGEMTDTDFSIFLNLVARHSSDTGVSR